MDCICEETRITYRRDGLTGNAAVRYHCAAKEHEVPRYTLPVRQKALPLYLTEVIPNEVDE